MSLVLNMVGVGGGGKSRLPSAYQEVEYLESTGTQGFLTGVYFKPYTTIHVDFMWTALTYDTDIIDVEGGTNGFAILINIYNNNKNRVIVRTSSSPQQSADSFSANTQYSADIVGWASGTTVFFNSAQWNAVGYITTTNYPLQLFGRNLSGTLGCFPSCRIYSCTIRDGGTLVRNFVPCRRKSDSVAGMYDLVNDLFYTNEGTGSFIVGADVR